jgi:hypothetical protein
MTKRRKSLPLWLDFTILPAFVAATAFTFVLWLELWHVLAAGATVAFLSYAGIPLMPRPGRAHAVATGMLIGLLIAALILAWRQ